MQSSPPPPPPQQPAGPPPGGPGPGGPGYGPGYGSGGPGFGVGSWGGARMPNPGNAEFVVFFLILIFLIVIWAASDLLEAHGFATDMTILTSAYLISRGIAKASRVLEH